MAKELSIGEIAARSGQSVSSLHFYERKGLIRSHRTAGNQRRYERDVLRRIALIQVAQEVGIPLKDVGAVLSTLPGDRPPTRGDWGKISTRWVSDLDRRIALLAKVRAHLTECIGCGCLSLDRCAILNPDDKRAKEGPGSILLQPDTPAEER